jgi:hypothetical protein
MVASEIDLTFGGYLVVPHPRDDTWVIAVVDPVDRGMRGYAPRIATAWNVWLGSVDISCGPPTRRPWARGIAIAWAWTPMRTACGGREPG